MVSKRVRAAIYNILSRSARYDANTMRISKDGLVSAREDCNKHRCLFYRRVIIGHVHDMVTSEGKIKEGW